LNLLLKLASNATSNAAESEKPQVDRGRVRGEEFKDMEEQDDFSSKRIVYAIPADEHRRHPLVLGKYAISVSVQFL